MASALSQRGLVLAVELSSALHAYNANLEALKSNIVVGYSLQCLHDITFLPE